jgi:retron-type reverse transcriptase
MQPDRLIRPLAASLSQQDWAGPALAAHLRQRLPASFVRAPETLAEALIRAFPGPVAPDPALILGLLAHQPEIARLLSHARRHDVAPAVWLQPPPFRPAPALADLPLPRLATCDALADWLALPPDRLTLYADLRGLSARTDSPFAPHYHHHLLPKADGSLRLLEEPKPVLKGLQRHLLRGLLSRVPPHDAAFGFCPGRNCIAAAARHAGEAVVLGFDLADFFPSIGIQRVYAVYRTLGYPRAVAWALAGLCTALTPPKILATPALAAREALSTRHLPQGAPTSPALANLCAHALDRRLAGLARSLGASYTRYADDLAFSGDTRIAPILRTAVPRIVAEEGFRLNPAKTRQMPAHHRQCVTGLVVNAGVNTPRAAFDQLKATLHRLARAGDPRRTDPGFLARLSGQIAWVEQVNPARGTRLRTRFDAL